METNNTELIKIVTEAISDRNSCLTKLAQARLEIITGMNNMALNDGNDYNGQKYKWNLLVAEAEKIDNLILQIHGNK